MGDSLSYLDNLFSASGAHHQEPATIPYSSRGVFTDRSIFSLNWSRIQIPTGTSVTNCNHRRGLMLTCRHLPVDRHDVDMFTWGRIVLSLPKRADVDWNWPISRKKISKTRLVRCKNAVVLAYYGSCRLLVMGCCSSTESKFLSCSNYPPHGEEVRARDKLVSRTRKPLPGSYIFFALSLHPFGK